MVRQRGISLVKTIVTLAVLGFVGIMAAKLIPAYIEWIAVKKIFAAMDAAGDLKGSVREIRRSYEKRHDIESITSVQPDDLEITKEGGDTVVSVAWSRKVPLVNNISACIDFFATTSPQQQ